MNHLDILIPFGLPPAEMAADLLRELNAPALATLITRAKILKRRTFDPFSRALPHEAWIAGQFLRGDIMHEDGSPPIATAMMRQLGHTAGAGVWFMLHPVHLHIARDHLVLTSQRQLMLSEHESHALFDAAKPLFDEIDVPLLYGDAATWFIRADDWRDLRTATPDAACGHNVDIWMPQGSAARDWRKLQNEVQMQWHGHSINAERESRGLRPVNSIWLWGGAPVTMELAPSRYKEAFNLPGWMQALSQFTQRQLPGNSVSEIIAAAPECGVAILDTLIEPALASEWSDWLTQLHAIERLWFAPLLAAIKAGEIADISLIFTNATQLTDVTSSKLSLRKFWLKPSLANLAS